MDLGDDATGYSECVRAVARHAHSPAAWHWKTIRKIITYLKATKDLGVVFRRGMDLKLLFCTYADYADRCYNRRSVLRVEAMLGNTAVSASSTTQYYVALSTSEVEYIAMAYGAKIALAIKVVLDFVQTHLSSRATDIYEDKKGPKALTENTQGSHRSKHIDVRCNFLRGLCEVGAGKNSQYSLGGTTCGHPYKAIRARGVPEAPLLSDEFFVRVFVCWM